MSNDDPDALQRALATIREVIENSHDTPQKVAEAVASESTTMVVAKPTSVFEWIDVLQKQIAPHAKKVPLPVVQGVAKIFPPAAPAVPIIRYLQAPAKASVSDKGGRGAGPGPVPTQIFIVPVAAAPPSPAAGTAIETGKASFRRSVQRNVLHLIALCRARPILALLILYALYRARGLPGKALELVDDGVNRGVGWAYGHARSRAQKFGLWLFQGAKELKRQVLVIANGRRGEATEHAAQDEEEPVVLDIGDAAWVTIFTVLVLYTVLNRKKIWRK